MMRRRVHHAARRCGGGVAARGARTAENACGASAYSRTPVAGRRRDAESVLRRSRQGLRELGWTVGRNLQIDYRWSSGNAERLRAHSRRTDRARARRGPRHLRLSRSCALLEASRTVPIVFAQTIDPVGLGVVESLSRPGGNITGFTQFEYSIPPKWLELLKEIAPPSPMPPSCATPSTRRALGQWAALQSVASVFAIELRAVNVRDNDAD